MAKLNVRQHPTQSAAPIQAATTATGVTHEGAPGFGRDPQSELFLMATGAFAGEGSFYEDAEKRDARFIHLVEACMTLDPWWTAGFLKYLRQDAKIRTAAIQGAAIGARWAMRNKLDGWARPVLAEVLRRPDEPGEFIAWWRLNAKTGLTGGVLRGLRDAVNRLYHERSLIKYDGENVGYRFGDVVELTHPKPKNEIQRALFRYAIDRRHQRAVLHTESLPLIRAYRALNELPVAYRREMLKHPDLADVFTNAGMTWEAASGWAQGPLTADFWHNLIPSMGIMALVRNLRNFDAAGINRAAQQLVAERIGNPDEVAKSGILPFQLYAAYKHVQSDNWSGLLAGAVDAALANVPKLPGRTLVLVDCSGSMADRLSKRSQMNRMEAAALFGTAIALRAEDATLVAFGSTSQAINVPRGASITKMMVPSRSGFHNMGGTETDGAIRTHFAGHDRLILLTDEQAMYGHVNGRYTQFADYRLPVPDRTKIHIWNFAGYEHGMAPGQPHQFWWGGMTDSCFTLLEKVEQGQAVGWPFAPLAPLAAPNPAPAAKRVVG